jgi:hypothetical protein
MVRGIENIEFPSDVVPDGELIVDEALKDNGTALYNRQQSLGITVPPSVSVIGVGGVGCWVALYFSLIGVNNIILIDNDKIDVTNLNRTMFKTANVGQYKTVAMKDLIMERRPHCTVVSYTKKYEDLPDQCKKSIIASTVIDCRDSIKPLERIKSPIIGGYNGLTATIHVLPELKHIWGEEESPYTIIPSYVVVPSVIAAMIVNHVCVENRKGIKESIMNIDFKQLVSCFEPQKQKEPAKKRAKKQEA